MSAAISIKRLWDQGSGPRKDEYKGFHRLYGSGNPSESDPQNSFWVLPFKQRTRFPATEARVIHSSSRGLRPSFQNSSRMFSNSSSNSEKFFRLVSDPDSSSMLLVTFQSFREFGDRSFGIDADSQDEYWEGIDSTSVVSTRIPQIFRFPPVHRSAISDGFR